MLNSASDINLFSNQNTIVASSEKKDNSYPNMSLYYEIPTSQDTYVPLNSSHPHSYNDTEEQYDEECQRSSVSNENYQDSRLSEDETTDPINPDHDQMYANEATDIEKTCNENDIDSQKSPEMVDEVHGVPETEIRPEGVKSDEAPLMETTEQSHTSLALLTKIMKKGIFLFLLLRISRILQ